MKQNLFLLCLSGFFLVCCKPKINSIPEKTEGATAIAVQSRGVAQWTSIFNGKDLEGWHVKIAGYEVDDNFGKTFSVEDGILSVRYDGYGTHFNNRFGALYYHKKLANYRLKVEYRFVGETAPGAPEWGYRDSGVQFHGQAASEMELNQSFPLSLEFNLHGGNGTDDRPVGEICANGIFVEINGARNTTYCSQPTVKRTFHGDQWVTLEIDVKDGVISHFVNGEKILTYTNPIYDPGHDVVKKGVRQGESSVQDGYISLQSNSHPIDFRTIELMEY